MALDFNATGGVKPPKKPVNPADPFQGDGVQKPDGGWVPSNHPEAQGVTPAPPPPAAEPANTTNAPIRVDPNSPNPVSHSPQAATPAQVQDVFTQSLIEQMERPAPAPDPGPDPFTAMGGGVLVNGGWVPHNHPLAQDPLAGTGGIHPEPSTPTQTTDPFAEIGGGQLINGGWVPNNHPLANPPSDIIDIDDSGPGHDVPPAIEDAPIHPAPSVTPAAPVDPMESAGPKVPTNPIDEAFRAAVLKQLTGGDDLGDVANDPRAAAYRVAQKRAQDRAQAQGAEDAVGSGMIGSGGFQGASRALAQSRGEAEASFEADIAGQRMQERRQDLANSMAIAERLGDRESAAELQREMAALDAQIRREGLDLERRGQDLDATLQREGFGLTKRDQDINAALQREGFGITKRGQDVQRFGIETSADLDRAQQALSRYGLDLSDKQTAQRLGFDYTQLQALMNRDAVLAALGQ